MLATKKLLNVTTRTVEEGTIQKGKLLIFPIIKNIKEEKSLTEIFASNIFSDYKAYGEAHKETIFQGYEESVNEFTKFYDRANMLGRSIRRLEMKLVEYENRFHLFLVFNLVFIFPPLSTISLLLSLSLGLTKLFGKSAKERERRYHVHWGEMEESRKNQAKSPEERTWWTPQALIRKNAQLLLALEKAGVNDWRIALDSELVFSKLTEKQFFELRWQFPKIKTNIKTDEVYVDHVRQKVGLIYS